MAAYMVFLASRTKCGTSAQKEAAQTALSFMLKRCQMEAPGAGRWGLPNELGCQG